MASMKRYGQVVRLKPESREEYIRCHRAVWPTVLTTIAECNIQNYSIFECGELLFGYFEYHGSNFAADMSKMAADPETQRWWALMFPMLEKLPPDIPGQRWTDLTEIFHFEGSSAFEEGRVAAHEDSQT
jgi:L-rhamnose mutarotase